MKYNTDKIRGNMVHLDLDRVYHQAVRNHPNIAKVALKAREKKMWEEIKDYYLSMPGISDLANEYIRQDKCAEKILEEYTEMPIDLLKDIIGYNAAVTEYIQVMGSQMGIPPYLKTGNEKADKIVLAEIPVSIRTNPDINFIIYNKGERKMKTNETLKGTLKFQFGYKGDYSFAKNMGLDNKDDLMMLSIINTCRLTKYILKRMQVEYNYVDSLVNENRDQLVHLTDYATRKALSDMHDMLYGSASGELLPFATDVYKTVNKNLNQSCVEVSAYLYLLISQYRNLLSELNDKYGIKLCGSHKLFELVDILAGVDAICIRSDKEGCRKFATNAPSVIISESDMDIIYRSSEVFIKSLLSVCVKKEDLKNINNIDKAKVNTGDNNLNDKDLSNQLNKNDNSINKENLKQAACDDKLHALPEYLKPGYNFQGFNGNRELVHDIVIIEHIIGYIFFMKRNDPTCRLYCTNIQNFRARFENMYMTMITCVDSNEEFKKMLPHVQDLKDDKYRHAFMHAYNLAYDFENTVVTVIN